MVLADEPSQRMIEALGVRQDELYTLARERAETPLAAERLLRDSLRMVMEGGSGDVVRALEEELKKGAVITPKPEGMSEGWVMPADVWARLCAVLQMERAKGGESRVLNPESVSLPADPLLAPKRFLGREEEEAALSPPSRFILATGLAIVVGVALTVYILTRKPVVLPVETRGAATTEGVSR